MHRPKKCSRCRKKSTEKYVLELESPVGWTVCFIVGAQPPTCVVLNEYLKQYKVKTFRWFTINC